MNREPRTYTTEELSLSRKVFERELSCLTQITAGLLASGGGYHLAPVEDLGAAAEQILDNLIARAGKRALLVAMDKADSDREKGIEVSPAPISGASAESARQSWRIARATRTTMKLRRVTRQLLQTLPGQGIRVYGEEERRQTQEALARFNAQLRLEDAKGQSEAATAEDSSNG